MKSLYESILDDEDILVGNIKSDIKKLDNPINYFISYWVDNIKKLESEKKSNLKNSSLSNDKLMNNKIKRFFKFDSDDFKWECIFFKFSTDAITINCSIKDNTNVKLIYFEYHEYTHKKPSIKLQLLNPQYIKDNFPELYNDKYIKNYKSIINKLKKDFSDFRFDNYSSDGEWNVYYMEVK
jgi:hypothetical protein